MRAVSEYLGASSCVSVLNDPNNILGIEYLKALKKLESPINPIRSEESDPITMTGSSPVST